MKGLTSKKAAAHEAATRARMDENGCDLVTIRHLRTDKMSDPGSRESTIAALFGQLVELAIPDIRHYLSDLYRDAQWLKEYVYGEMTFYYGTREMGTSIGTELAYVEAIACAHVYRVDVVKVGYDHWYAEIGEVRR